MYIYIYVYVYVPFIARIMKYEYYTYIIWICSHATILFKLECFMFCSFKVIVSRYDAQNTLQKSLVLPMGMRRYEQSRKQDCFVKH